MKKLVSEKEFNQWVKDMCDSWNYRGSVYNNLQRVDFDTTTMIVNPKTGKTSIAKLHPQDKYVPYIGLAVAWAKYKGLTVPTVAEELKSYKDLKFGDIFIVKSNIVPTYIYVGTKRSQFVIARQNRSSDEEIVTFSANNNTFYRVGNILNKRGD